MNVQKLFIHRSVHKGLYTYFLRTLKVPPLGEDTNTSFTYLTKKDFLTAWKSSSSVVAMKLLRHSAASDFPSAFHLFVTFNPILTPSLLLLLLSHFSRVQLCATP